MTVTDFFVFMSPSAFVLLPLCVEALGTTEVELGPGGDGLFSAALLLGRAAGAVVFGSVAHAIGDGRMWAAPTGVLSAGSAGSLPLEDGRPAV